MRPLIAALLLFLALPVRADFTLSLTAPAWGQDFEKGQDAYVRGDYATALREWRPLAEQGDAEAQFRLGVMYANGRGVALDIAEAWKWWRKAAQQGHTGAEDVSGLLLGGMNYGGAVDGALATGARSAGGTTRSHLRRLCGVPRADAIGFGTATAQHELGAERDCRAGRALCHRDDPPARPGCRRGGDRRRCADAGDECNRQPGRPSEDRPLTASGRGLDSARLAATQRESADQ